MVLIPGIAALAGLAVALFLLERVIPLRRRKASLVRRLAVNLVVSALGLAAGGLVVGPVLAGAMGWSAGRRVGLVRLLGGPAALQWALAFLVMDLSFYYWHRVLHQWAWLWRFHVVHHIDPDLDVGTALRFHFGEVALSAAFRAVQVAVIGITPAIYAAYELVFQANTLFHHSNVRTPIMLERRLNWLLVTPRMHGIHHSQVRGETNSNYSVVFPWWDWLHRSLRLGIPQAEVEIGVPAYSGPEDNRLGKLLTLPFRRQRDDWPHHGGPARSGAYGADAGTMLE